MNIFVKFCIQSLFVVAVIVSISGICLAGHAHDYSGYPHQFDGSGKIDIFKGGKYITINDTSLEITNSTKYNRPGNLNCSKGWFKKNDFVYYLLEKNSQKIVSLWLAKDKYMGRGTP